MDNPPEGENKQIPPSWPNHQVSTPAPFVSDTPQTPAVASSPSSAVPSSIVDQPHTSRASTLIIQWLTYAFWGWTVLTLSALTTSVFQRLVAGQAIGNFNYYVIAALFVLLPISFICDTVYSKNEPDKKVGPSSLVMVIHAIIFALFTIGALLFAAWSVVSLATNSSDRSSAVAELISALIISVLYAATFMRTLNPSHIRWIPKVYRLTMLGVIILFVIVGFAKPTFNSKAAADNTPANNPNSQSYSSTPSNNFGSNGKLEPSVVGGTQCDIPTLGDGSTTGQVALTGGATCDEAEANIQSANGKNGGNYTANGYTCTSTSQGANTQWSSYWNNDFYSYNCTSGSKQVAFNLQTVAQSNESSSSVTN